jgi:hypothetical protein
VIAELIAVIAEVIAVLVRQLSQQMRIACGSSFTNHENCVPTISISGENCLPKQFHKPGELLVNVIVELIASYLTGCIT